MLSLIAIVPYKIVGADEEVWGRSLILPLLVPTEGEHW